jgi:hypothetical protein
MLPLEQRAVVELAYVGGYSCEEIGVEFLWAATNFSAPRRLPNVEVLVRALSSVRHLAQTNVTVLKDRPEAQTVVLPANGDFPVHLHFDVAFKLQNPHEVRSVPSASDEILTGGHELEPPILAQVRGAARPAVF